MFHCKVLVIKFGSIYAFTTRTISILKISPLNHEFFDNSMKNAAFEMQWFIRGWAEALFSSTESSEIFGSFRHEIVEKLDDNASNTLFA